MAEPAYQLPEEDQPNIGNSLRAIEGGGQGDGQPAARGKLAAVPDDASLPEREQAATAAGAGGGLYSVGGDSGGGKGTSRGNDNTGRGIAGGLRNSFSNARGFASRHKAATAAGAAGGGGILLFLAFLMIIAGALKLPTIMGSIQAYEFARVTTQFSKSSEIVSDEALAVEAADQGTWGEIKTRFSSSYTNIRNSTWGRLDAYRPEKVIQTLGQGAETTGGHSLELHYKANAFGREVFTGAKLDGVDYPVEQVNGISRGIPGLRQILKAKNNFKFVQGEFYPALDEAMKVNGTGTIIRGAVANRILSETGGSRAGWLLSKFKNKTGIDAQVEATRQQFDATEGTKNIPDNAVSSDIKEGTQQVDDQLKKDAANPEEVKAIIANGGDDIKAQNKATQVLSSDAFKTALGDINTAYAVAAPICMIYDGSIDNAKSPIDKQTNQEENAFDQLAAESAMQKKGSVAGVNPDELANAVAGTNYQIGDVAQSIPYQRASGGVIDTSQEVSAESAIAGGGSSGDFSLINAIGVPPGSPIGDAANFVVKNVCGQLTSIPVAAGLAALNVVACVVTACANVGAEQAAGQGAKDFIVSFVKGALEKFTAKTIEKDGVKVVTRTAANRGLRFAGQQGKIIGATIGLTYIAHLIVADRAGAATNGFAQNTDLINMADAGANIEAGKLEQQQLFGRPLEKDEVAQSDAHDKVTIAAANSQKGFTQRYFALDSPDSLLNHMAITMGSLTSLSNLTTLFQHLGALLMEPLHSLGSLFTATGLAHADNKTDPSKAHYNNVQFGWSQDEEALIDSSQSYKPLENQEILDQSGKAGAIADKYAVCFGYKYDSSGNGDFDPNDSSGDLQPDPDDTLGSLLSGPSPDITRDKNGNVTDDGLCSKKNLSYDNSEFGAQMVFRFRLACRYNTTLDHLINEQTVSE